MANWLNQLQSLLGQSSSSTSSSADQGLGKLLVPGALGGLAGLLVFAAKSDGHIDAKERAAIDQQLSEAGVEEQGRVLIEQAIEQPLDPQRLATGVRNEEEALEIYFLSCAAIDIDHFMERSYLNALGDALKIPQDVRDGIERDLEQQKRTLAE